MKVDSSTAGAARTSAFGAAVLGPVAVVVSEVLGRTAGRVVLVLMVLATVACLAAAVVLARRTASAWVLITGSMCVLGGGTYLWSVRNVPAVIPIAGVLAVLLGLALLALGGLAIRVEPAEDCLE